MLFEWMKLYNKIEFHLAVLQIHCEFSAYELVSAEIDIKITHKKLHSFERAVKIHDMRMQKKMPVNVSVEDKTDLLPPW